MNAVLLTVMVSLALVALFAAFFVYQRRTALHSCAERDSLLPLQDEDRVVDAGKRGGLVGQDRGLRRPTPQAQPPSR
ncbi:MAG: hypothetical protein EA425_15780 [Puniceicoccaceae bacterium]|nr:MAG: hypothetical protein EA425_15780 [Puniceicoccaceae bacterium]